MILTNTPAKREFYLLRHFSVKTFFVLRHTHQRQDVLGLKIVASSCPDQGFAPLAPLSCGPGLIPYSNTNTFSLKKECVITITFCVQVSSQLRLKYSLYVTN